MMTKRFINARRHRIGRPTKVAFSILLLMLLWLLAGLNAGQTYAEPEVKMAAAAPTPIFRFPVVPGAVISGYFDHNPSAERVTFYNGRQNSSSSSGFYFSCSNPSMYDFVGCEDPVGGEASCANNRELWYDGHKGIDYEYSPSWHTGAVCDPGRFAGITRRIYAPAAGKVMFAGWDASRPANGYHIRIKHDLNRNGNYEDDNFRSNFLHFTSVLEVSTNDIVREGQPLGVGGSTGYSSSPHLHFEVQKSSDNFNSTVWSVDPYGWSGQGGDPWPYQNTRLWQGNLTNLVFMPSFKRSFSDACPDCQELIRNGGFESGAVDWVEIGVDIIDHRSYPNLPISPYGGDWLAWFGGRNNAADTIYQDFVVPDNLGNARLTYVMQVTTAETGGFYDYLYVRLRTTGGEQLLQLDSLDNTFSPTNQWVVREVMIPDLVSHQGETLRLSFEATTDSNAITSFYVDNVILESQPPNQ